MSPAAVPPAAVGRAATRDEEGVAEVIAKFREKDPGLAAVFASAAGYAVYPTIGKGGIGIGGARGKGWVYERGHVIGRSTMNQVTKGGLMYEASVGGQKFSFTPVGGH